MGLRDRLKSRTEALPDAPAPAVPASDDWTPFERAYGRPDPSKLKTATTVTVLTGAEAERHLAQPVTPAVRDGLRAAAQVEGLTPHPGDAVSAGADDVMVRAERLLRRQRGE